MNTLCAPSNMIDMLTSASTLKFLKFWSCTTIDVERLSSLKSYWKSRSTVLISQRESKHAMPLCTTHISWREFFVNTHCPPLKAGCHETLFLSKLQQGQLPLMRCSWRPFTDTKRSPARTPACIWSKCTFDPNNIKGCLLPWKSVVFSSEVFSSDVLIQKEGLSSFCQFYQP